MGEIRLSSAEELMERVRQQMIKEDIERRTMMHFDAALIADRIINEAKAREAAK